MKLTRNVASSVFGVFVSIPISDQVPELMYAHESPDAGTAAHLEDQGLPVERVNKVAQGRPHIVDKLTDGDVQLVFNTTEGWQSLKDSFSIRTTALNRKVPYFTTAAASFAAARSIGALRGHALEVKSLQSYYSASKH